MLITQYITSVVKPTQMSTVACGQSKEITAFKGYQLLRVQGL